MISKEDFIAQLERGVTGMGQLPVSLAMLRFMADELRKGEPAWWKKTLKAWEKREFYSWTEPWTLFLTCVHFEALNDAKNPMVRYFPSCGGTPEADPAPALAKFLDSPPDAFWENLRKRQRRVHVPAIATGWYIPALEFFLPRGIPFYLVQVNAGSGLDLASDVIYRTQMLKSVDPDLIQARIGLDPTPLMLQDILHRRWQTAAYFPDAMPDIKMLDSATDVLLAEQRHDPNFIQLVECPTPMAPKFISKNIPSDDPEMGLLVFQALTSGRFSEADYAAYTKDMAAMMAPWGDRALWVDVDTVRNELFSTTLIFRLWRLEAGVPQMFEMQRIEPQSGKRSLDQKGTHKFLSIK